MKKVILMAAASLAIFATSFAQSATAPAPKAKMTKTRKPAMDAPAAQGTPTPAATSATGEKGEGHGKGHGEARGEGGQGQGGLKALGLTPEQDTKFKAANQSQKAAVQAVQKDASLAADAKVAQIAVLKSKYESEVQGILTADQFAKWTAMRAKRDEKKPEGGKKEGQEGMGHREGGDHKKGGHKADGGAAPAPADGSAAPTMKVKKTTKSN
jgi:periplasmic protein CpxP/Spy